MPEALYSKNMLKEDGLDMRDTVVETAWDRLEFLVWETCGGGGMALGTPDLPHRGIHAPMCAIQLFPCCHHHPTSSQTLLAGPCCHGYSASRQL